MAGDSIYDRLPPDFYDQSQRSLNPVTQYYHRNRYAKIRRFIAGGSREGMRILDIGSGSGSWNTAKLPVTGMDENRSMLEYGKRMGYLERIVIRDLNELPLPVGSGGYDFVVISEVLEHLDDPGRIVSEAFRVLKKGGMLIVTVPLDTFLSPWQLLFGLECVILGDILGKEYYRGRCGHIHHFSVESLGRLCQGKGFEPGRKDVSLMNIGMAFRKP